jgi:formate hydrogenlyase subunit 3/multisubunit Na+/H+ antiporter MnhD subunit
LTTAIIAVITILITGCAALVENDAKRILAYSTIAQLAYILLGFAGLTTMSIAGGLVFLLAHSLAKAGLFLCVGIIEHKTHTKDIRKLGGLIRRMPLTAASFILCTLTIVGFPPTAGFFGKLMIIMGVLEGGNIACATLAVVGALVTLLYMVRMFTAVFMGEDSWPQIREGTPIMLVVVLIFAATSLALGFVATPLLNVANTVVAQMLR